MHQTTLQPGQCNVLAKVENKSKWKSAGWPSCTRHDCAWTEACISTLPQILLAHMWPRQLHEIFDELKQIKLNWIELLRSLHNSVSRMITCLLDVCNFCEWWNYAPLLAKTWCALLEVRFLVCRCLFHSSRTDLYFSSRRLWPNTTKALGPR